MNEKNILRHEKSKPRKVKKEKKSGKVQSFFKALLIILIIAALTIGGAYLYKILMPETSVSEEEQHMIYSPAESIESVSFKNSFIINTIDGIKILNKKGEEINDEVTNMVSPYVKGMKEPVFCTNDKTVLIFDIAGKTAVLFNEAGIIGSYNFTGNIISGKMSESGHFVIVVEDAGSKAAVKAYSEAGVELLTWYSGKGYVADATIHNSKKRMAIVTNEIENGEISSKILLFVLDNSEPYMGKIISNSFCTAVSFYNDSVYALCENGLYYVNKEDDIELIHSFSGEKMKHFRFFDNGNVLLISENSVEENYRGVVINTKGKKISDFSVDSFLDISDVDKNKFLVIKRKGVLSINHKGKIKEEIPCQFEVKDAKYFKDKIAVLSQDKIIFE